MRFKSFRWAAGVIALAGIAAFWQTAPANADTINMTAGDSQSQTSFNTSLHWSNSEAPSAAHDYVANNALRSPTTSNANLTFAGNSLAITSSFQFKNGGTSTYTINNLTINNGGKIWQNQTNSYLTLAGNGVTLGTGTATMAIANSNTGGTATTVFRVLPNISGAGTLKLTTSGVDQFNGFGYLSLEGTNTYAGGTKIIGINVLAKSAAALPDYATAGSLVVTSGSAVGMGGALWVNAGGADEWTDAQIQTLLSNGTFTTHASAPTAIAGFGIDTGNASSAFTYANDITDARGAISFTKRGAGTLVLSGNNAYSGGTKITGGVLQLGSANAIGSSGQITFGGGTLQYSAANTTDYSSRFNASENFNIDTNGQNVTLGTAFTATSAVCSLNKTGAGMLTLSLPTNSQQLRAVTVSAGTLNVDVTGSESGGMFNGPSDRSFTVAANAMLTASGQFSLGSANKVTLQSCAGGTVNNGGGKLSIAYATPGENYLNNLTMYSGSVISGTASGVAVGGASNGTITTSTSYGTNTTREARIETNIYLKKTASAGTLTLNVDNDTNATGADLTITGDIADMAGYAGMTVVKKGAGAMILRDAHSPDALHPENYLGIKTFTGKTIVEAGWLRLGSSGYNGMLTGDLEVQSGAEVLIATGNKATDPRTVNYGGNITGTGGITQEYCGTGIYSGNHNYSGDTYIDGMYINNGSFTFDVNNAGDSSRFMQFEGSTGNGIIEANGYTTIGGTASFDGVLNLDVSDITDTTGSWTLVDSALTGLYNMTGMNLVEGGLTIASFTGSGGDWSCTNGAELWSFSGSAAGGVLNLSTVPEPGTLAMLSAALLGLIAYAWRRRK